MSIDPLTIASGAKIDATGIDRAFLEANAEQFLAVGGMLTLAEYGSLSPENRAALVKASDSLRRKLAAAIADELAELFGDVENDAQGEAQAACDAMAEELVQ